MKRLAHLLLAIFLAVPATATAVTVRNLYDAEVPVKDQSAGARNAAIRAAFIQVMVKLTGNRNAAGIYGVSDLLERAGQYVRQYEYRSRGGSKTANAVTTLWVRFDSGVIDDGMREYNIPVWGQERPSTLVWLVIRDDLGQRFASLDEDSRYFSVLQEQAMARGITFITPLYDLQDAAAIKTSDVMGGFTGPLMQASQRYQPDAVLAGTVVSLGQGLWEGRWLTLVQGVVEGRWTNTGDSVEIVLSEGMDGLADNLATRFAQVPGYAGESTQEISIVGVNSFSAYARTLNYLESLNFVSSVNVKSLDTSRIVYELTTRGSAESLAQALELGRVLEPFGTGGEYQLLP